MAWNSFSLQSLPRPPSLSSHPTKAKKKLLPMSLLPRKIIGLRGEMDPGFANGCCDLSAAIPSRIRKTSSPVNISHQEAPCNAQFLRKHVKSGRGRKKEKYDMETVHPIMGSSTSSATSSSSALMLWSLCFFIICLFQLSFLGKDLPPCRE